MILIQQTGSEGLTTVDIWANDSSGNLNHKTYQFTFDDTPPTQPQLYPPSPINNLNTTNTSFNFNWSVTDNSAGPLICNLTINGIVNQSVSTQNNTATNKSVIGFPDGNYTWYIICYDNALNSNTSETRIFTVDTIPPSIILNSPVNNSVINSGTWINLTIVDTTRVDKAWYSVNNGTNMTLNSPYNINTTNWVEGLKIVSIWANDSLNNLNNKIYYFTIDNTLPKITVYSPENNSYINVNTPSLNVSINDSRLDSFWYSLDSGVNETNGCNSTSCIVNLTKNWIVGSGGDNFNVSANFSNTTYDLSGNSAILGLLYDTWKDLNYEGWTLEGQIWGDCPDNMLSVRGELYYPDLNVSDISTEVDVMPKNDGGLIIAKQLDTEYSNSSFYLSDTWGTWQHIARWYNGVWDETLNSSSNGCPANTVCKLIFKKEGNVLTTEVINISNSYVKYNTSPDSIKYDYGSIGVHGYRNGYVCYANFRAYYPETKSGNITSIIKDAYGVGGSGSAWKQIKFDGIVPNGTNVSIYVNTSSNGTNYTGWRLVKSNALPGIFYGLPPANQQRFGQGDWFLKQIMHH
ncbi:MAG TPA: hypothetical protein EYP86_05045 [Candidatus Altiarchaeales archaeon]|nr:hypothetical protein [Candidatus Altiarchaeales archaeon]